MANLVQLFLFSPFEDSWHVPLLEELASQPEHPPSYSQPRGDTG